jgi:glutamate synthase domain-containing protein 3
MSGGDAFVLDAAGDRMRLGPSDVCAQPLQLGDERTTALREIVETHAHLTGSATARALLDDWPAAVARFRRFAPLVPQPTPVEAPAPSRAR